MSKSIYAGIPALSKKLPSDNTSTEFDQDGLAAFTSLLDFHDVDVDGGTGEQIMSDLAWKLIKCHVPAFSLKTPGAPSKQDRQRIARLVLFDQVDKERYGDDSSVPYKKPTLSENGALEKIFQRWNDRKIENPYKGISDYGSWTSLKKEYREAKNLHIERTSKYSLGKIRELYTQSKNSAQ